MKSGVQGLDELGKKIKKLIEQADSAQAMAATMKAGEAVADEMRALVAVDTGGLKRSIMVARARKGKKFRHEVRIGPRYPQGAHAHLVEFGTGARTTKPRSKQALAWAGGEHPVAATGSGAMPAKPFMRPAADASGDEVRRVFYEELRRLVLP
jgi:HK97 gp10 family phage protein